MEIRKIVFPIVFSCFVLFAFLAWWERPGPPPLHPELGGQAAEPELPSPEDLRAAIEEENEKMRRMLQENGGGTLITAGPGGARAETVQSYEEFYAGYEE